MCCGSLAGWASHGEDLCGLAGHPVLSSRMVAGGDGCVCGRHPAEESVQSRQRIDFPTIRFPTQIQMERLTRQPDAAAPYDRGDALDRFLGPRTARW